MNRTKVFEAIGEDGIIAVIRSDSAEGCERAAEAALLGKIRVIEITMTVPGAVDVITRLVSKYGGSDDIIIGAGTVLDPETARICLLAGARFIVSPSLNIETIKLCNRYAAAVIPGVMTVTEAISAMEYGCLVLKLFPAGVFGPSAIKTFKGPLPQLSLIPTGGVNLLNAGEWIRAGAFAIGIGGELTSCGEDYDLVAKRAEMFVNAVAELRKARD
jgi:2-dehydro-3-deoxyphosphogluconate aldolase/(4S)-4-hydroxy-2-oxoglutarate aldolase